MQGAYTLAVSLAEVAHVEVGAGCLAVSTGRLMRQQGDRVQCFGARSGQQLDLLSVDFELRLLDYHAIDRDPAAFDVQLGLAA